MRTMNDEDELIMEFDMNTIEHLGISMYSTLPPVLAEIVANSYDADATEVFIELYDEDKENKSIVIKDNGYGMGYEDFDNKFLIIGRNRRLEEGKDRTPMGRPIIGRKGIGKLSIFGVAERVNVTSIKDGIKNKISMNLPDIKDSGGKYEPDHLIKNKEVDKESSTTVELLDLNRKSRFDIDSIKYSLAKRFLIFDDNFKVWIVHNGDYENKIRITNDLRFDLIDVSYEWEFPHDSVDSEYIHRHQVKGNIYASEKPLQSDMKGIYLTARGKLVHDNSFYGLKASDYQHAYLTGWLEVDFIDEDSDKDRIASYRESLLWDDDFVKPLRNYLQNVINFVAKDLRKKRKKEKVKKVSKKTGIDIPSWMESLPKHEKRLAEKITKPILESSEMDEDESSNLIEYIRDSFEMESFKEMANELEEIEIPEEEKLIELFKEWKFIESREFYKLAMIRIETIKQFEKYIKKDAREVPTIHEFLKTFPWLLDPRIMNFEDEEYYSSLLEKHFPEEDVEIEENKRIDFLCVDFANNFFVIELKRPGYNVNSDDLDQVLEYTSFIEDKIRDGEHDNNRKVTGILVCGGVVDKPVVRSKIDSYKKSNNVYIKNYHKLLNNARSYHSEFLEKYEEITGEK